MITKTRSIMTKNLITIPMGTPLIEAYKMMATEKIRHLPVVDMMDDIVGILSQRDLNYLKNPEQLPVEFAMSAPVIYVAESMPLREAIAKMLELKISCLMVADTNDNAVGILTTDDLLSHLAAMLEGEHPDRTNILNIVNLQTVGEVANQLANVGI